MSTQTSTPAPSATAIRLAEEAGIDINSIEGTGKDGLVKVGDVKNAINAVEVSSNEDVATQAPEQSENPKRTQEREHLEAVEAWLAEPLPEFASGDELNDYLRAAVDAGVARRFAEKQLRRRGGAKGKLLVSIGGGKVIYFPKPVLSKDARKAVAERVQGLNEANEQFFPPKKKGKKDKRGKDHNRKGGRQREQKKPLSPAEILMREQQKQAQKAERAQEQHEDRLVELLYADAIWEGQRITDITKRQRGQEGLAFFHMEFPSKDESAPATPVAGLILYGKDDEGEDSFKFVSLIAQDSEEAAEVQRWHNQLANKSFLFRKEDKKLSGWATAIRMSAERSGSSDPLPLPGDVAERVNAALDAKLSPADADAEDESTAEVVEVTDETPVVESDAAVAAEATEVSTEAVAEVETEVSAAPEAQESAEDDEDESQDESLESDADDGGYEPDAEMSAILAELHERGIGSKSERN